VIEIFARFSGMLDAVRLAYDDVSGPPGPVKKGWLKVG